MQPSVQDPLATVYSWSNMALETPRSPRPFSPEPIRWEGRIPKDAVWFDGHFPQEPILPGVAQLCLVEEMLRRCTGRDASRVSRLRRVRFKLAIRPGDTLSIEALPIDEGRQAYSFKLFNRGELCCSGIMELERPVP